MIRNRCVIGLVILMVASLACGRGIGDETPPVSFTEVVNIEAVPTKNEPGNHETDFPLPEIISNLTDTGNGSVNFQTEMSVVDVISFYRDEFTEDGYTERSINTAITETTFSMVFDGHASGRAIVIQGVDLGNGSTNISIRFEDI